MFSKKYELNGVEQCGLAFPVEAAHQYDCTVPGGRRQFDVLAPCIDTEVMQGDGVEDHVREPPSRSSNSFEGEGAVG